MVIGEQWDDWHGKSGNTTDTLTVPLATDDNYEEGQKGMKSQQMSDPKWGYKNQ